MSKKTRVIAFANQKGGVGKTTSTFNFAAALAKRDQKVLVLDLDPQANLSKTYGISGEGHQPDMHDFLKRKSSFEECLVKKSNLHLIPCSISLASAEVELSAEAGREMVLKERLKNYLDRYDYVVMDCPPSLGVLALNAMTAASEVVIVVKMDNYSIYGTSDLLRTIQVVQERLNPELKISGMLGTCFDSRNSLDKKVASFFQEKFPNLFLNTLIRQNVALKESPTQFIDIFEYDPHSNGAEDYLKATEEIMGRA